MDNENDRASPDVCASETLAAEVRGLAQKIAAWGASKGYGVARLCREFPALGSDRTFRALRDGATDGYNLPARLADLRGAWALIQELGGGEETEPVYDSLGVVSELRRAVLSAMRSFGSDRVVIVQGQSGVGKSTALRLLSGRYGRRIAVTEACDAWGDRPNALLGAILRSIGYEGVLPHGPTARLEAVQDRLTISRTCVAIDEAHHLGPHCLNTIKTLVNTTPGEFVLVAIPTLWHKLESQAYMEARQLSTNRLSERVKLQLDQADVCEYLRLSRPEAFQKPASARRAATIILPSARQSGNMAFVRDVARLLPEHGEVSPETVASAVAEVCARR